MYGRSLREILSRAPNRRFSLKCCVQIGMKLIDSLEALHRAGVLHLDLKPDNILLGERNMFSEKSSDLVIVDFGISKRYLNDFGAHVEMKANVPFCGNVYFAS